MVSKSHPKSFHHASSEGWHDLEISEVPTTSYKSHIGVVDEDALSTLHRCRQPCLFIMAWHQDVSRGSAKFLLLGSVETTDGHELE